ncbi:T9SS type A sorting domain-containing protein, partial [Telluribacter humicola]
QSGSSISVSPSQTTTYTATCSANGCTSSNSSVTVTVNTAVQTPAPAPDQTVSGSCVVNKVRLVFRTDCCFHRLNGASLQGSNDRNSWTTIYNFTTEGTGKWQEFSFGNTASYRYVRYVSAPNSAGELVEIEFYNGSQKLSGTVFGSSGSFNNDSKYSYQRAMDGVVGEMWHGASQGTHNFVGLDLSGCSSTACTPPSAPGLTASASTITSGQSTTLTASNCSGTVSWSNGQSGSSISVSPSQTTTYTATCSANGCTSSNGTVTVTVTGTDKTDAGTNCSALEGFLDAADCGSIAGWVYDKSNPNAVLKIDIYDNSNGATLIQSGVTAGIFRQDLLNAGKGNGNHGFYITTPSQLKNGQSRNISVRVNGCSYTLSNSFKIINCSSNARTGVEEVEEVSVTNTELTVVSEQRMSAWPNPTKGELEVSFYVEEQKDAVLSVVDMMGVSWFEQKIKGAGQHQEKINLSNSVEGIYIIQLKKANSLETKKIIVTH